MGKRRLIQAGKAAFPYHSFLGYRPGPDGRPEIDPEQAKTVKRIFYGYLAGKTQSQLKAELEQDHVPSPAGKTEWSRATIQNMLHNEKYVGDTLSLDSAVEAAYFETIILLKSKAKQIEKR